jgi:hypothetical protein
VLSSIDKDSSLNPSYWKNFVQVRCGVNWQLKAILPVGFVLLAGLMLFILATVSLQDPERHIVLIVAGAGAVAICAVSDRSRSPT